MKRSQFVDLKGFEDDYEISKEYPHEIRNKNTNKIVSEYTENTGYIRISLKGRKYQKHRLVAYQFIENPNGLQYIDHINHDRTDNRIENLRWVSQKDNLKNKASSRGIIYRYFDYTDFDDEDMEQVNEYKAYHFENYYYNQRTNKFYFDTGVNYRELHISFTKNNRAFVRFMTIENKLVNVLYNTFKRIHNLN